MPVPSLSSRPLSCQPLPSQSAAFGVESARPDGAPARCFRSGQVIRILGISRRQLQYWADTGLVVPSARTPGGHHRYTFEDLVALRAAKQLIDAGVSVQRIRKSITALKRILPTVRSPLAELVLVATGDVVLAFRDGAAFDAVSGQQWVFEVAQLQREVEAWQRSNAEPPTLRRPRVVRTARASVRTA